MAVVFERIDPERALAWNSHDATALLQLAEHHLPSPPAAADNPQAQTGTQLSLTPVSKADLAQARDLAQEALRFDPLAPGALTELGRAADGAGDSQQAATLMELAAGRALRDGVAQGWLATKAAQDGNFAAALTRIDVILRTQPEAQDSALPLLAAFVSFPNAEGPLAQLMGTDPPWRSWFLKAIAPRLADLAALRRFYAALLAGPHPPNQEELQPFLGRLVKEGLYKEAYAAWVDSLPPGRKSDSQLLYNGEFQYPVSGSEFDWAIDQTVGADVSVVSGSGDEAGTLRVEFSGARVDFHNVSHLLALAPGTYRLSGEVEADELRTGRGLRWRLFCAGQPEASLGQTELLTASTPWRAFALSFTVPATACQAQVLRLELPARVALERNISGVVSYRNLAVAAMQSATESVPRP